MELHNLPEGDERKNKKLLHHTKVFIWVKLLPVMDNYDI